MEENILEKLTGSFIWGTVGTLGTLGTVGTLSQGDACWWDLDFFGRGNGTCGLLLFVVFSGLVHSFFKAAIFEELFFEGGYLLSQ